MSKRPKIINFRFDDEFIAEVEAWRERQDIKPSRTEMFKSAVREFMAARDSNFRKNNKERACK
jgi:hypothetical protein